jgi:hypothetical protein
MGRAKVISTDKNSMVTTVTACSIKFTFPITDETAVGEFIKMERRDGQVTIHFTKKLAAPVTVVEKPITVTFD